MLKNILAAILTIQLTLLPVGNALAEEPSTPPAEADSVFKLNPLPPLSFSILKKGVAFTPYQDMYMVTPETWAYLINERESLPARYRLELDTSLALQSEKYKLKIDVQQNQIDFLTRELDRTNLALESANERNKWAWVGPVVFVTVGALVTTGLVYGLTKGNGIE